MQVTDLVSVFCSQILQGQVPQQKSTGSSTRGVVATTSFAGLGPKAAPGLIPVAPELSWIPVLLALKFNHLLHHVDLGLEVPQWKYRLGLQALIQDTKTSALLRCLAEVVGAQAPCNPLLQSKQMIKKACNCLHAVVLRMALCYLGRQFMTERD